MSNTRIFARASASGRQYLVYSMSLNSLSELAMILPIPVPKSSPEDAVRFISFEKYPKFFRDLERGFPKPRRTSSTPLVAAGAAVLEVHDVGSYSASFVPSAQDFNRLDPRFRLPPSTWDRLPQYRDYGFAVFMLKKGNQNVHPMAFEFPRRNSDRLFFPTVHIHDGRVHDKARFDHSLYCQISENDTLLLPTTWRESPQPADAFVDVKKTKGVVAGGGHCYRLRLRGNLKNKDAWV